MSAWQAPADLDPECLALCQALNALPGIQTYESCCGHGKYPYRIWVQPAQTNDLAQVAWFLDNCHSGMPGWQIIAYTDCAGDSIRFMIEGPVDGFAASEKIAAMIEVAP